MEHDKTHKSTGDTHPRHQLEHEHDEVVCGKDCKEWIKEWYKWAYETGVNPFVLPDPDKPSFKPESRGQRLKLNNTEEGVWFLANPMFSYTSTGTVVKVVNLPCGILHFLAPVYNCHPSKELHPYVKNTDDLVKIAKEDVDKVYYLEINLDGINLGGCRVPIEEPFPINLKSDNIFGLNGEVTTKFVSDGYWIFLNELKPGDHILRLKGYSTVYKSDVEFHLGVAGPCKSTSKSRYI
jgi:hypothetical protein